MKKLIAVLLMLLLVVSMVACKEQAPTEQGNAQPANTAGAATAAPAALAATAAPEPTERPFEAVMAEANEKLAKAGSFHVNQVFAMEMNIAVIMGEMQQDMPVDINYSYAMDVSRDPDLTRMDVVFKAMGEEISGKSYVTKDGEDVIVYSMEEGGAWDKQVNPQGAILPEPPNSILDLFADAAAGFQKNGTMDVNGKTALVFAGALEGKRLPDIFNAISMSKFMTGLGVEMSEEVLGKLSDIPVTVMIDEESGLPVWYTVDMTDVVKELMENQELGGEVPEGVEINVDVPDVVLNVSLSDFDSIEPFVIPEEALNAEA